MEIFKQIQMKLYGLIPIGFFPQIHDVENERKKIDFFRVLLGVIGFIRFGLIAFSAIYYFEPTFTIIGQSVSVELLYAVGVMALFAMLAVGLLTPLTILLLFFELNIADGLLVTRNLGSNMMTLTLILLLMLGAGKYYSLDRWLLEKPFGKALIKPLYKWWPPASIHQIHLAYWVLFLSFAGLNFGALMFHLQDPTWLSGQTFSKLSANYYLSRFPVMGDWLNNQLGWAFSALSATSIFFQTLFQAFMVPLVYNRFGKWFVIGWGWTFFILSVLLLQLSYLPFIEVCLWGMLFIPTGNPANALQVLYDDRCSLCKRAKNVLTFINCFSAYKILPLSQHTDLASQNGISEEALKENMHGIGTNGRIYVGYDLYYRLTQVHILLWPLYPLFFLGKITGIGPTLYQWVANNRYKLSRPCQPAYLQPHQNDPFEGVPPQKPAIITSAMTIIMTVLILYMIGFCSAPVKQKFNWMEPWRRTILYNTGLWIPNVFNSGDLQVDKYWYVMTRQCEQGNYRVPINMSDGRRDWYHWFDPLYFGNNLTWRRRLGTGRKKLLPYNAPGAKGYEKIKNVARFDKRLNHRTDCSQYDVTFHQKYKPTPVHQLTLLENEL